MTLSEEENRLRLSLYNDGLFDSEIAKHIGITTGAIQFWRKSRNLPPQYDRKHRMKHGEEPSKEELAAFYYDLTKTIRDDTTKTFGFSKGKLYHLLKKHDIPLNRWSKENFALIMSGKSKRLWEDPEYKAKMVERTQTIKEHHEAVIKKAEALREKGYWAYPIDVPGYHRPDVIAYIDGKFIAFELSRSKPATIDWCKKVRAESHSVFDKVIWLTY